MKMFMSDNNSGVHPKILEAIINCNFEHEFPYGNDSYSKKAIEKFREVFGKDVDVYFVATGTGTNIIGLSGLLRPFEGVICPDSAHINVDECGAFERFTGSKLLYVPNKDGKLKIEDAKIFLKSVGDEHQTQPRVISITQATEFGTIYTVEEIKELADFAHENNMLLHVDGARIANAAAALGVTFKGMITDTGVDLLSFGGTKNGMMLGEAIVCFNPEISRNFKFLRKQGMQLISKMRFVSAQFIAYLKNDLWKENALHSNSMAKYMAGRLKEIPNVYLFAEVQSNMVFAQIPKAWIEPLLEKYYFYVTEPEINLIRLVTSFDTTKEDIDQFIDGIKEIAKKES